MAPPNDFCCRSPGSPSRASFGTRQSSSRNAAVSEARMPSLCSRRSSISPGLSRSTTNDLIAARPCVAVQRGPHHEQVGALARGHVDLLAVEHVLVAVEHRGGADGGRVRAGLRLGDGHAGPQAVVALGLLLVRHRGDRRVAQALARQRQQQADVAPAQLHDAQHGRRGWSRCGCRRRCRSTVRLAPLAPAPLLPPPSSMPSISAASMSSSLGCSCSARSYLREIGRSISAATRWACPTSGLNLVGVSRLIIRRAELLPSRRRPAGRGTSAPRGTP